MGGWLGWVVGGPRDGWVKQWLGVVGSRGGVGVVEVQGVGGYQWWGPGVDG